MALKAVIASVIAVLIVVSSIFLATEAQSTTLYDDFNNNIINNSKWLSETGGSGSSISETDQILEVTHSSTASGSLFFGHYKSVCKLSGDFDIEVDYDLLQWPSANGIRAALAVRDVSSPTQPTWMVERVSIGNNDFTSPKEAYLADLSGSVQGLTTTSDTSGILRLARTGNTITAYSGISGSATIASGSITSNDLIFIVSSWGHDSSFSDKDVKVGFDNVVINKGTLTGCDLSRLSVVVRINEDLPYTKSPSVLLSLVCRDDDHNICTTSVNVKVSVDGTFDTETFEPFRTEKIFDFDLGEMRKFVTLPSGDGIKTVNAIFMDAAGRTFETSDTIILDTTAPSITSILDSDPFSPNGDSTKDVVDISFASSEAGTYSIAIKNSAGTTVRTLAGDLASGATWDGSDSSNAVVPDGTFTYFITATDQAGNARLAPATGDGTIILDTAHPDTSFVSVVDGNAKTIANSGSTLSTTVIFTFTGTDTVGITGFECSLDGAQFSACTNPASYSNLAAGSYTFKVRAIDKAGNTDATPAAFTWQILIPAEAAQKLIDQIKGMGLDKGIANSLTAKLNAVVKNLNDENPNNDKAVCNELTAFINEVNAQSGKKLTKVQADELVSLASDIKKVLGC